MAAGKMDSEPIQVETPSVISPDSDGGGYDCDFVQSPPDDLLCKICHYPARNAILSVCCGHNFCKYCLDCYLHSEVIDHSNCPYCRENFQSVPDKRTTRLVFNLQVFCPNKSLGCSWVGELRSMEDHLNKNSTASNIGCLFTEICCSNECGVVIQRRLLEDHLKLECELRQVKCEYCDSTGSYQWIIGSHQQECLKYPMECPNHCEVGHVRREEMNVHLKECPLAIVKCPFAVVGCDIVVRREERIGHMKEAVEQHVECNKEAIMELERAKTALEEQLQTKEQELADIKDMTKKFKEYLRATIDEKDRELGNLRKRADVLEERLKVNDQVVAASTNEIEHFKKVIDEKGKELNEMKNNTDILKEQMTAKALEVANMKEMTESLEKVVDDNSKELNEMRTNAKERDQVAQESTKQLKEMFEQELMKLREEMKTTKQQLQHQVEINEQLQQDLQCYDIPKLLPHLIGTGSQVIPFVIKLTEFENVKKTSNCWQSPAFYTSSEGYKMCLKIRPNGLGLGSGTHVSVDAYLMSGEHDDQLTWPVKGSLSVQLFNQISDSNHGGLVKFRFDGAGIACKRVKGREISANGVYVDKFIFHKSLYAIDDKYQYFKNGCIFLQVTDFK
ncbi:TNF receptor-associated factor 3-like [Dysidea avara]|uniref:TNF receptor-associated factor 3-like n=1 Tax=Dysidea avara TaxID=196820 RepID=UPI003326A844